MSVVKWYGDKTVEEGNKISLDINSTKQQNTDTKADKTMTKSKNKVAAIQPDDSAKEEGVIRRILEVPPLPSNEEMTKFKFLNDEIELLRMVIVVLVCSIY
jgi:hypothetical protein